MFTGLFVTRFRCAEFLENCPYALQGSCIDLAECLNNEVLIQRINFIDADRPWTVQLPVRQVR